MLQSTPVPQAVQLLGVVRVEPPSQQMPEVVAWNQDEPAAALAPAVRHLAGGGLVALPTESTYELACSALNADAVGRLGQLAGDEPIALVLSSSAEASDWLPALGGPARRLLRKIGPGPWKLVGDGGLGYGLFGRLPRGTQDLVRVGPSHVALRFPEHSAWGWSARLLRAPLVSAATPAPITDPTQAGADVALVVDAGPSFVAQPPTVVRVTGERWQVERLGSVPAEVLDDVLAYRILFVCTGNTCRSPMAEALCARLLAKRLGCTPEELPGRGFRVQSAGLAAMMGGGPADEAVATLRELGADLSRHRSQPLTLDLLGLADRVYAMTASHLRMLQGAAGPELPAAELLSPEGLDVADPIGAELAVYQACARDILAHLERRLPELTNR